MLKRILIVLTVLTIALTSASVIYAQGPDGRPLRRPHRFDRGYLVPSLVIWETAHATDMQPRDVIEARINGESINDFLTANGVPPESVAASVTERITEWLAKGVENERIYQATADEILANLETRLGEIMSDSDPIERSVRRRPLIGAMEIISDATGLDPLDIADQLRDGKSLAQVIEENGASVDTVKAQIITSLTEEINNRVDDPGRAAEMIEKLEERVDTLLNRTFEGRRI